MYTYNENVRHCPDCHSVIGMDRDWEHHEHDNLACKWLGQQVHFRLGTQQFIGEVITTERIPLTTGLHDILTVEFYDHGKQIKIQGHRQGFRRIDV